MTEAELLLLLDQLIKLTIDLDKVKISDASYGAAVRSFLAYTMHRISVSSTGDKK